ncbi:MAG: 50S ribosomal protein L32 [Lachnospiraceae bacterium]|nr:50S ribosomal protein L32 [Lachnospiraceae bacterium]
MKSIVTCQNRKCFSLIHRVCYRCSYNKEQKGV